MILLRPHVPSPAGLLHAVANLSIRHASLTVSTLVVDMSTIVVELYRASCHLFPDLLVERDADGNTPLIAILLRPASECDPGETLPGQASSSPSPSSPLWTDRIMPELVHWSLHYAPDCAMIQAGNPSESNNQGSCGWQLGCQRDHEGLRFPVLLAASRHAPLSVVYELLMASIPLICP
jgi:hypothetical protein